MRRKLTDDEKTLAVLVSARALISDRKHWTRRSYSRDVDGDPTAEPHSGNARSWCALGAAWAVSRVMGVYCYSPAKLELEKAAAASLELVTTASSAARLNDTKAHTDVLAMYDRAIATVRARVEGAR